MDLARAPRRAPLTARKKGSGYENAMALGTRLPEYVLEQPRSQGFSLFVIGKAGKGPGTGPQNKYNQKGHSFDVRRSRRHRPAYTRERAAAMFLGSIV